MAVSEETIGTARAVATNTFWGTLGRLGGGLFAVWSLAVISRSLGPEQYGNYATAMAFFYIWSAVADFGLYQILVRDLGRPDTEERQLVGTALFVRAVSVTGALLVGLVAFFLIPQYANLRSYAAVAAAAYIPLALGQVVMAVFQKHLRVRSAAAVELFARFLQLVGVLWLARLHETLPAPFLWVLLISTIAQAALLLFLARRYVLFTLHTSVEQIRRLLRSALPVGVSLVFTLIYFRLDTVLLSLLQGSEAVGIYNLAYKVLEQLIFLPAMFIGVLTPILARERSENPDRFAALTEHAAHILLIAIVPIVIGGIVLRRHIIALLGGVAYSASADVLIPLLGAVALIFAGTLIGALVIITDRQRRAVKVYGAAMVASIILNLLLIPKFSYMGAAWTTVVTEVLVTVGLLSILRGSSASVRVANAFPVLLSGAAMATPLLFVSQVTQKLGVVGSLVFFLALCPVIYGGALLMTGAIDRNQIRRLMRNRDR